MAADTDLPVQLLERFREGLRSPFGRRRLTDALADVIDMIDVARRRGASWAQIAGVLSTGLTEVEGGQKLDEATLRGLMRRIRQRRQAGHVPRPTTGGRQTAVAALSNPRPSEPSQVTPQLARSVGSSLHGCAGFPTADNQRTKAERLAEQFEKLNKIQRG